MNESTDPFAAPIIMSCHEWSEHLRGQLKMWNFEGIVHSVEKDKISYQQIWLVNNNQRWLSVIASFIPPELQPWQIQSITSSAIIWQIKLPEYCQSPLVVRMGLGEK